MRHANAFVTLALLVVPIGVVGCDDDPEPRREITVSGPVDNRTEGVTIIIVNPNPNDDPSDDARVIVAWSVASGTPDYTYVHGQGTFAANGERFTVRLDAPPPDSALNAGILGVGLVVAVNGAGFDDGDLIAETSAGIIGLAGQYAIIYIAERGDVGPDWMDDFPDGYSVGIGVDVEGGFDAFRPVGANEIELIIDDLGNIDVVNWT